MHFDVPEFEASIYIKLILSVWPELITNGQMARVDNKWGYRVV